MISGLFAIVFLSATTMGVMEVREYYRKQLGQSRPNLLQIEKQTVDRRFFFWGYILEKVELIIAFYLKGYMSYHE